jgi:hypothetical protein
VNVTGFSEQDQANLWHNVTDAQSKAKQGLGQGSALKAVAGARWSGRRTKIDDSDDEAPETHVEVEVEVGEEEACIVPSKRKQEELLAAAGKACLCD